MAQRLQPDHSLSALCSLLSFGAILLGAHVGLGGPHSPVVASAPARSAAGMSPPDVQVPARAPDVPYVPTPPEVVSAMLELARVGTHDVVYDLGSGDGRIVIAAAQRYGARGVGVEIDPARVREAREKARAGGVAHLVTFLEQDLFEADISGGTVVTLYLLPAINLKLRPKLLAELRPGTRIVSHAYDMGDWTPAETRHVHGRAVHLWVVPDSAR